MEEKQFALMMKEYQKLSKIMQKQSKVSEEKKEFSTMLQQYNHERFNRLINNNGVLGKERQNWDKSVLLKH
jgi:hypothetical protein